MDQIGECCEGGQLPMPKMDVKHPTYMVLMNNPQMMNAKQMNDMMSKETQRIKKATNAAKGVK